MGAICVPALKNLFHHRPWAIDTTRHNGSWGEALAIDTNVFASVVHMESHLRGSDKSRRQSVFASNRQNGVVVFR
jgi:hypothetical protein